ncbi:MAG: thiamine pyrophosphate-dependent enzyme [Dehalococcoidia bacterium]
MTTTSSTTAKKSGIKNSEYDFKWCPGCGDFGVRRALEMAVQERVIRTEIPIENTVVVAGIGCSGNLVHLMEGDQPFGIHGVHGRTLPLAFGIKMIRPELDVIIVAGDGDFLSIGAEHIAPQAQRNLDVCAIVMDNGVYGLTKGQSSPTTELGVITPSTPYGKLEGAMNPLEMYLTSGVSFIASGFSGKPKDLAKLITAGIDHPGFSIVQVQSPCTTYNDNYEQLKGNPKKGIEPGLWALPEDYDSSDRQAAYEAVRSPGIPVGIVYQDPESVPLQKRQEEALERVKVRTVEKLMDSVRV